LSDETAPSGACSGGCVPRIRASGAPSTGGTSVSVDTRRNAVVDVSLDSGVATYSWVSGKPHPRCEEIEGGR